MRSHWSCRGSLLISAYRSAIFCWKAASYSDCFLRLVTSSTQARRRLFNDCDSHVFDQNAAAFDRIAFEISSMLANLCSTWAAPAWIQPTVQAPCNRASVKRQQLMHDWDDTSKRNIQSRTFFRRKKCSCDEALLHIFIFVLRKKWNNFEAWLYYECRYEKIRWINYSDLYVSFIWWWELRNAFLKETNQNKSLASSARNASWHYRLDAVL